MFPSHAKSRVKINTQCFYGQFDLQESERTTALYVKHETGKICVVWDFDYKKKTRGNKKKFTKI